MTSDNRLTAVYHGYTRNDFRRRYGRMERRALERRRAGVYFRWPERRSGFDRRDACVVAVLRESSSAVLALLALLNLLNVLDWRFTMIGMERGAIEANPFMAAFFGIDSLAAGLFKVAVMLTISLVIWRMRHYRRVLELTVLATVVYAGLILYHLVGLTYLLPAS